MKKRLQASNYTLRDVRDANLIFYCQLLSIESFVLPHLQKRVNSHLMFIFTTAQAAECAFKDLMETDIEPPHF